MIEGKILLLWDGLLENTDEWFEITNFDIKEIVLQCDGVYINATNSIKEEELVNKIQSMLICDIDGNPIDNLPPGVKRINNRMTLLGPYSAIIKCGFVP